MINQEVRNYREENLKLTRKIFDIFGVWAYENTTRIKRRRGKYRKTKRRVFHKLYTVYKHYQQQEYINNQQEKLSTTTTTTAANHVEQKEPSTTIYTLLHNKHT